MRSALSRGKHYRQRNRKRVVLEQLETRDVPALVAALGFNENAGGTIADSSGAGNGGTISGASWLAAGRHGAALSFDGTNDWVTVADAASLDLTTAMTIEAWVRPAATATDWSTVVLKERAGGLSYALYASDGAARPPAGYVHAGGSDQSAVGGASLPLNTWSHVAVTYNGSSLILYVNAVQVGTRSVSGSAATSSNPLRIGGNSVWGEYFNGAIDEIRIYNNALTQAQIQSDMNTPIGGSGTDNTPPAVTAATPLMGAIGVSTATNFTVTFSEDVNPSTVSTSTFELRDSQGALVPATVSYNPASRTATLDPTNPLPVAADFFKATVKGGPSGVKDVANNALVADFSWSASTGTPVFQETTALGGLVQPTVIKFAPDGRVFVAEKSGLIKVFDSLSDTSAMTFIDLRTNVFNAWDRGLLGMTLSPDFATNPYVYVLYTLDAHTNRTAPVWGTPGATGDPLPNPPGATGNGVVVDGRLARIPVLAGGVAGTEEILLEKQWIQQFPSHSTGTVAFGADGALYVSAGDGASFSYVDYGQTSPQPAGGEARNPTSMGDPVNEGGALRSQDLLSASDPTSLDGAIVRLDPNTGAALPTNPLFATGNDENARRIVAFGLRNPFRFTFRPGTNELWVGDVGWNTWEEINRIQDPADALVENFGWPAYEGPNRLSGYDAANLPLLEGLYSQEGTNPNAFIEPYYAYQHSEKVDAGSTEPTGSSAIAGLAFSRAGNLPSGYDGALFFTDYNRDTIWVMYRGVNGLPDTTNRKAFYRSSANALDAVNLEIGPDGSLFFPDFDSGTIRRIGFVGANQPPNAVLEASTSSGPPPLAVNFNGSGSSDPDNDPLTFAWDLDGDGEFDDSTSPTPSFTYAVAGVYQVQLRVADTGGLSDVASEQIIVGNRPEPVIDLPAISTLFQANQNLSFAGHATDQEDGVLPTSALTWTFSFYQASIEDPNNINLRNRQVFPGVDAGTYVLPDWEYPVFLTVDLTATDSTGLTQTQSIRIDPQTTTLTFVTNPIGLTTNLNGRTTAAPYNRILVVNSINTIGVASPQSSGSSNYIFGSWSDGGAQSHLVTAPAAPTTFTANFTLAPTGFVAAYGFNEGSGSSLFDTSGNGLNGLLSGPTWNAAGRFGGALSFDGVNDWVTVNDNNLLDLTNGMTLSAWVRPTAINGWETVLLKELGGNGLSYSLYAADNSNRPPGGYVYVGGSDRAIVGSTVLSLNTWTHLATTYDGIDQRLFVNGVQVASRAQTGNIGVSNNALRIGGNAPWGEYFNGLIDEIRVYNRARTQAEIQSDMNTPVGGGGGAQLAEHLSSASSPVFASEVNVASLLPHAVDQWVRAGIPAPSATAWKSLPIRIVDLPGLSLGYTNVATSEIWIDDDAAGAGWFVDMTQVVPGAFASGFSNGSLQRADSRVGYELLTVLAHELGHLFGLESDLPGADIGASPNDLMYKTLATGVSRSPSRLDVELALNILLKQANPATPANGSILRTQGDNPTGPMSPLSAIELLPQSDRDYRHESFDESATRINDDAANWLIVNGLVSVQPSGSAREQSQGLGQLVEQWPGAAIEPLSVE